VPPVVVAMLSVHAKRHGMANPDHGIPIRTSKVFDIAPVLKQFGAWPSPCSMRMEA
jgi:hypothetical protein